MACGAGPLPSPVNCHSHGFSHTAVGHFSIGPYCDSQSCVFSLRKATSSAGACASCSLMRKPE
jgi:hypothetical protein